MTDEKAWKNKSDAFWKSHLTDMQYKVCRQGGTEPPFTGALYRCTDDGVYLCAACGLELFSSEDKYDSGTGWPSFSDVTNNANLELRDDRKFFMTRTEVSCKRCGAHLGHVFDDGPPPTQKRYCINSASLSFGKKKE